VLLGGLRQVPRTARRALTSGRFAVFTRLDLEQEECKR
jgi:hypothetical protein